MSRKLENLSVIKQCSKHEKGAQAEQGKTSTKGSKQSGYQQLSQV